MWDLVQSYVAVQDGWHLLLPLVCSDARSQAVISSAGMSAAAWKTHSHP